MDVMDWRIKKRLEERGVGWSRATYIDERWRGELPENWSEDEIPADLQDWSKDGP